MTIRETNFCKILRPGRASGHPPLFFHYFNGHLRVTTLFAVWLAAATTAAADWSTVTTPSPGPPQSIGFYTAGCLQGAQPLPLDGPGYEAIRISRNRYWGHPVMLEYIATLAASIKALGQAHLYI